MNERRFLQQLVTASSEGRELQELDLDTIARALEPEALAAPVEEYGDPFAEVRRLIEALNNAGRSADAVALFKQHVLSLRQDAFGIHVDMFNDSERLYRFTINTLIGGGHMTEAEEITAYMLERGLQYQRDIATSVDQTDIEQNKEYYLNRIRLDMLYAKIQHHQSRSDAVMEEEIDLAGDLIASIPEEAAYAKVTAYLKLAEVKQTAGNDPYLELSEAERIVHNLAESDLDKFRWVADVTAVSIDLESEGERRLQELLQVGYRALHIDDAQGEAFKDMISALRALHGNKTDSNTPIMSPQFAADVSDPFRKVIQAIAKKGNAEMAFQLAETELFEDWTRWEAYEGILNSLPIAINISPEVFVRLRELCHQVGLPLERDQFEKLLLSLAERDMYHEALELIDLSAFESKYKRQFLTALAEKSTVQHRDTTDIAKHLPEPRMVNEWASLGMWSEAESTFGQLSIREKIKSGVSLVESALRSGRDIKGLVNQIYRAMQEDRPLHEIDSEYDFIHEYMPRDLYIVLLKQRGMQKSAT